MICSVPIIRTLSPALAIFKSFPCRTPRIINILVAIAALFTIGDGVYISVHQTSACQQFLNALLLVTGGILFLVSLIGLLGSWGRINFFLCIFLTLMFLSILGIIAVTIFVFAVTNEGAGKAVSGTGYKEYRLGDYSDWLQNHLAKGKTWDRIKSCMVKAKVCHKLVTVPPDAQQFYKLNLTPIESGCCKPQTSCELEFENATFWTVPENGPAVPDSDCMTWSNDQTKLCFNCKSCHAGFLANIKSQWKTLLIINGCTLLLIVVIYSTGRGTTAKTSSKIDTTLEGEVPAVCACRFGTFFSPSKGDDFCCVLR